MVFNVSGPCGGPLSPDKRRRLDALVRPLLTKEGSRDYRVVELGTTILVSLDAAGPDEARRVVATILGARPDTLTATARDA